MGEAGEGFEVFVQVVDSGSVSGAARVLGSPRETVSRQLARLEDRLGVRLLHRSTRRLLPTAAGEELFARVRPLVLAAREAEEALRQRDPTPRGLVRLSVPPGPIAARVATALAGFLCRWPQVQIELTATSRHVDLAAEGYDLALRAGTVRDPSLIARRLWVAPPCAVASPAYLSRRGRPGSVDDLVDHDCILGMGGGDRPLRRWPLAAGGEVAVDGPFASDSMEAQLAACREGLGIGLFPRVAGVLDDVARGRLVELLPGQLGAEVSLSLVALERARMPVRVRAVFDHLIEALDEGPPLSSER
jgi:DNA-binding transcriptional LysR family regulator